MTVYKLSKVIFSFYELYYNKPCKQNTHSNLTLNIYISVCCTIRVPFGAEAVQFHIGLHTFKTEHNLCIYGLNMGIWVTDSGYEGEYKINCFSTSNTLVKDKICFIYVTWFSFGEAARLFLRNVSSILYSVTSTHIENTYICVKYSKVHT